MRACWTCWVLAKIHLIQGTLYTKLRATWHLQRLARSISRCETDSFIRWNMWSWRTGPRRQSVTWTPQYFGQCFVNILSGSWGCYMWHFCKPQQFKQFWLARTERCDWKGKVLSMDFWQFLTHFVTEQWGCLRGGRRQIGHSWRNDCQRYISILSHKMRGFVLWADLLPASKLGREWGSKLLGLVMQVGVVNSWAQLQGVQVYSCRLSWYLCEWCAMSRVKGG